MKFCLKSRDFVTIIGNDTVGFLPKPLSNVFTQSMYLWRSLTLPTPHVQNTLSQSNMVFLTMPVKRKVIKVYARILIQEMIQKTPRGYQLVARLIKVVDKQRF